MPLSHKIKSKLIRYELLIILVLVFFILESCLSAERSPFDMNNPSNPTGIMTIFLSGNLTLGGGISGLTSSGLVLSNGASPEESLSISSGETGFQFTNPISLGSTYNVTITTQPTGNVCTISNNTGIAILSVSSILITCTTMGTLYALNVAAQTISVFTVDAADNLSSLTSYTPAVPAGFMLWNGKHLVTGGGGTGIASYLRNADGTLTLASSFTLTNSLDGGSQYFAPSKSYFYAHISNQNFSKIQIDTNGIFSGEIGYGANCYTVLGPVHPTTNNLWVFDIGCGQFQFYYSITNTATGTLGGRINNSALFSVEPLYPEAGIDTCIYSADGNYMYCADGGDIPAIKSGGNIKQMSVSSTALVPLSPFSVAPETPAHYLGPKSLILHPNGNYLFVYGNSNIHSYNLNTTTGLIGTAVNSLSAPNSCGTSSNVGTNLQINTTGTALYAICPTSGQIGVYPIATDGTLGTPTIYASVANSGRQQLLYVAGQ